MAKERRKKAHLSKEEKLKWLIGFGKRTSKKLRDNLSHPEKKILEMLQELDYEYIVQHPIICREKYLYILDFYFPKFKMAIEVQSIAHHTKPEDVKKDGIKKRRVGKEGINIIYLWAKQIEYLKKENLDQLLSSYKIP